MGAVRLPLLAALLLAAATRAQAPPAKSKPANPALQEVPINLDLSDPKAKPDPIIFVEPPEPYGNDRIEIVTGLVRRELYRQAFLLAARDEFGLTVRDGTLGEVPPDDLPALTNRFRVNARFAAGRAHEAVVEVGPPAASRKAWQAVGAGPSVAGQEPIEAVAAAEALSRGGYVTALKRAGHGPKANPIDPKATVPADVEQFLKQMTFTAQFAAVRQLHETLRTKGESPATLGGLSRAYANLGMLTDTQWGAAPWVYKARSLLYAERLRQRDLASPWGHWHRAFAAALAGMHAEALADLKAADAVRGSTAPPDWVPLVDALCRFESAKLKAAAKDGPLADTAAVFHFLTVENTKSPNQALTAGQAVVQRVPECYRVHDALAETGGVGAQHRTTLAGLEAFTKTFPARVAEMPGLPKAVAEAVQAGSPEPELVKAIMDSGKSRDDRGEPSWAALGWFAREARLVQVYRRLVFLRYSYSVPVDEFLAEVKPLVADHPLYPFLETVRLDPERDKAELQRRLRALKVPELTYRHARLLTALGALGPDERVRYSNIAMMHGDNLYYDDYLVLRLFPPEQNTSQYARRMLEHSPYAPIARAALVNHDWAKVKAVAGEWEKEAQHPEVFLALGRRAITEDRMADAERVIGRAIELSPDLATYRALADAYKKKGDTDKWIATLERYLNAPDPGLGHAQVQVEIAEHLMGKKEYAKAKPYADAAAETYAAWAMLCAAKCEEGLSNWDTAEQWVRRVAERYDNTPQVWCTWCLRTGRGDRAAARALLEEHLKKNDPPRTARDHMLAGVLNAADGEHAKAAARFAAAHNYNKHDVFLMAAALEYDAAGDAVKRDKVLAQVSAKGPYDPLVTLLKATLAKGEREVPTADEIESAIKPLTVGGQTDSRYFVGRFLQRRGQAAAADYLKRTAADPSPFALSSTLAGLAVQELDQKK